MDKNKKKLKRSNVKRVRNSILALLITFSFSSVMVSAKTEQRVSQKNAVVRCAVDPGEQNPVMP